MKFFWKLKTPSPQQASSTTVPNTEKERQENLNQQNGIRPHQQIGYKLIILCSDTVDYIENVQYNL